MEKMGQHMVRFSATHFATGYDGATALQCEMVSLEGGVIAVVGHNGAGKSTLMKAVLNLLPTHTGSLQVTSISDEVLVPERHMAFCPETGAVFADISVEHYIKLWCRLKHNDGRYYRKEGSKYIELLHLEPLLGKLGRELSKGQKRRVQTAVGFFCSPKLFLFDEPFDGLDVQKTRELSHIMQDHTSEMSFLISSHRMDVVERLADKVIVLQEGKFRSVGSVRQVCEDLSGRSLMLKSLRSPKEMYETLRTNFPHHLIDQLGEGIRITGVKAESEEIERFVRSVDSNGVEIGSSVPTLVDAMNYHLQSLAER